MLQCEYFFCNFSYLDCLLANCGAHCIVRKPIIIIIRKKKNLMCFAGAKIEEEEEKEGLNFDCTFTCGVWCPKSSNPKPKSFPLPICAQPASFWVFGNFYLKKGNFMTLRKSDKMGFNDPKMLDLLVVSDEYLKLTLLKQCLLLPGIS